VSRSSDHSAAPPRASGPPPFPSGPATAQSLWPADLLDKPLRIPQGVLEAQAGHLRDIVGGELHVEVRSTADMMTGVATHRFVLRIRALDKYEYELLRVSHHLARAYPCGLRCDAVKLAVTCDAPKAIQDDRALAATLGNLFKADAVRTCVRSLHAQAVVEGERAKKHRGRRAADDESKR